MKDEVIVERGKKWDEDEKSRKGGNDKDDRPTRSKSEKLIAIRL